MICTCEDCKEEKKHYAKGRCEPCFYKYREQFVDKDARNARRRAAYALNSTSRRKSNSRWKENHYEQSKQINRNYYHKNKERVKGVAKAYRLNNPDKLNARTAKRRANKLNRTPKWLTEQDFQIIRNFYRLAKYMTKTSGFKWEVDHIIPLSGKLVSGLHVPLNLQVIPSVNNRQKLNNYKVH